MSETEDVPCIVSQIEDAAIALINSMDLTLALLEKSKAMREAKLEVKGAPLAIMGAMSLVDARLADLDALVEAHKSMQEALEDEEPLEGEDEEEQAA